MARCYALSRMRSAFAASAQLTFEAFLIDETGIFPGSVGFSLLQKKTPG